MSAVKREGFKPAQVYCARVGGRHDGKEIADSLDEDLDHLLVVNPLEKSRFIELPAQSHVGDVFRSKLRCLGIQSMLCHQF